ncbi:MAG: hypothetical protein WD872_13015 [Pirellulaceae bacterium]
MRKLARRLLAASQSAPDLHAREVAQAFEAIRGYLTRLTGADGFSSLLRRAIALARAEAPELQGIKLGADGRLEGLEEVAPEAAITLAAHLLGLLVTFIGEPLMLRLVREVRPDASLNT